jgi:hypothetical protein
MRLIHVPALSTDDLEHLLRVGRTVHSPVFRMGRDETAWEAALGSTHEPVHRFGKDDGPMSAEMHVGFLGGNQQEVRIRLGPQRLEIRVQFVEPQIGEIVRMAIAVKVHDHRGVDAHRLQDRLEGRRPRESIRQRLLGVRQMPVRAERLVARERGKAIRVGEAKHVSEGRLRRGRREQEEHPQVLGLARRRVDPRVELPVLVAELSDAEGDAPSPRAMPDVAQVRREVARKEVFVWRREHRDAAAGGLHGQRPIPDLDGDALGLEPVQRDAP